MRKQKPATCTTHGMTDLLACHVRLGAKAISMQPRRHETSLVLQSIGAHLRVACFEAVGARAVPSCNDHHLSQRHSVSLDDISKRGLRLSFLWRVCAFGRALQYAVAGGAATWVRSDGGGRT